MLVKNYSVIFISKEGTKEESYFSSFTSAIRYYNSIKLFNNEKKCLMQNKSLMFGDGYANTRYYKILKGGAVVWVNL